LFAVSDLASLFTNDGAEVGKSYAFDLFQGKATLLSA
jgi:hypothetical protein